MKLWLKLLRVNLPEPISSHHNVSSDRLSECSCPDQVFFHTVQFKCISIRSKSYLFLVFAQYNSFFTFFFFFFLTYSDLIFPQEGLFRFLASCYTTPSYILFIFLQNSTFFHAINGPYHQIKWFFFIGIYLYRVGFDCNRSVSCLVDDVVPFSVLLCHNFKLLRTNFRPHHQFMIYS